MNADKKVVDFVEKHRICVLTTTLDSGQPHSAAMHYASTSDSLSFVFLTERES